MSEREMTSNQARAALAGAINGLVAVVVHEGDVQVAVDMTMESAELLAAAHVREAQEPLSLLEALAKRFGQPMRVRGVEVSPYVEGCHVYRLYNPTTRGLDKISRAEAAALLAEREGAK